VGNLTNDNARPENGEAKSAGPKFTRWNMQHWNMTGIYDGKQT